MRSREEVLKEFGAAGADGPLDTLGRAIDRIRRMEKALLELLPYRKHKDRCEIAQTDFCTCGMKEAADTARAALTPTREASDGE